MPGPGPLSQAVPRWAGRVGRAPPDRTRADRRGCPRVGIPVPGKYPLGYNAESDETPPGNGEYLCAVPRSASAVRRSPGPAVATMPIRCSPACRRPSAARAADRRLTGLSAPAGQPRRRWPGGSGTALSGIGGTAVPGELARPGGLAAGCATDTAQAAARALPRVHPLGVVGGRMPARTTGLAQHVPLVGAVGPDGPVAAATGAGQRRAAAVAGGGRHHIHGHGDLLGGRSPHPKVITSRRAGQGCSSRGQPG